MQTGFDFGGRSEIAEIRDRLARAFGPLPPASRRSPIGQLVRSLIGSQTLDEVSEQAYHRLIRRYPRWSEMAAAMPEAIQSMIADVTRADDKARQIGVSLRIVAASHSDFSLDFLKGWSVDQAMAWLERLPGVGPKVAAATLNFSTLNRDAFVADTHVLRVLGRFGFVDPKADIQTTQDAVRSATIGWRAEELAELHSRLKYLGQTVCRHDEPLCAGCPIESRCMKAMKAAMAQQAKRASFKASSLSRRPAQGNRKR